MKVLLVYPTYPDTFWSFRHVLGLVSKRAGFPPLGLATVASMLPEEWEKRLIDMNVTSLGDEDVRWADYVFISAMEVQKKSAREVIERCNGLGVRVVAGGPLFTTAHEEFDGVDHFVLNEAEVTLAPFLRDVENDCARRVYTSSERPDITQTPNPMWKLLDMKKYASMNVQYSRGCPYNCEFCDITFLNGHRPRTKDAGQLVAEMESLYQHGWRGNVFIVDDNFIGNKRKLKAEVLPALIGWSERRRYPFSFTTEASVNMADDEELMNLMVRAGFSTVFLGIETPDEESLEECGKFQNRERDLVATVKTIQNHGFQVQGGFIVGFDNDTPSIFRRQIEFIQRSGITTAMVGLLNAPKGTRLYERLRKENRLVKAVSGDNMDFSINFKPKMDWGTLVAGYRDILNTIYSPKNYYERVKTFLREYRPPQGRKRRVKPHEVWTMIKTLWALGVIEKGRVHFWKSLITILLKYRSAIREFVTISAYGIHFRKIAEQGNSSS